MEYDAKLKAAWDKLENSMGVKVFDEREHSDQGSVIRYGYLQKTGDSILLRSFSEEKKQITKEKAMEMLREYLSRGC